ncbi:MAG: hypothetical protein ACKO0M_15315 [Cyanobium sp.]
MARLNLADFVFTPKSDIATASYLHLETSAVASTLGGDDVISATVIDESDGSLYQAIANSGIIDLGKGDDSISASMTRIDTVANTVALLNNATGTIHGGDGNDTISGQASGILGCKGLVNLGLIDAGSGRDVISGSATGTSEYAWGLANGGTIMGGDGADVITGSSNTGTGIYNEGLIDAGRGNDEITGGSDSVSAITNGGTILMGAGNDIIDASRGGFYNYGTVNFGKGNDILKGFNIGNSGIYDGGAGIDRILLGDGIYLIEATTGVVSAAGTSFNLYCTGFERIGGLSGGLFAFATGTLTVTAGIATFAA